MQEPHAVVRVVGMGADPPVRGPEELGERREGLGRLPVDRLQLVVAEGDGHLQRVDEDPLSPAHGQPGQAHRGDGAAGQGVDGQVRRQAVPTRERQSARGEALVQSECGRTSRSRWFTSRC